MSGPGRVQHDVDAKDHYAAHALAALAGRSRAELEALIEPGSALEDSCRQGNLGRADIAAHLAVDLADAILQCLQGHR